MVRHFAREYQKDPVNYIRQQEQIHEVISNAPAAILRAATAPARAVINHMSQNKNGNNQINNK
jgi:hypothetical protein